MEPKKILIVSRSFYPMNSPRAFRTTELVKEFSRQGHDVTLLTVKNNEDHIPFEEKYGVTIKNMGPLRYPKIGWAGRNRISYLSGRALEMGVKHLLEYPDIELMFRVKKALRQESGYDLLISIAVPHPIHWGVARARSQNRPIAATWAADCGDPYMGFRMDRFNKPFWFKFIEKYFCRKADYITVPIEGAKEAYYEEFRHKIRVIPQGFNFDEVEIGRSANRRNGIPVFGYAGGLLGGGRNPVDLMEHLLTVEKPFRFVIYTNNPRPVEPYIPKLNGKVEIHGYIPRKELLNELAGMDFLVNLENDTSKQAPSKLIDYYLTGRPVLSVPSSGLQTEEVDRFLCGDYSGRYTFENMDRYRIETICNQFLRLCSSN